jgi:hypothetical protein
MIRKEGQIDLGKYIHQKTMVLREELKLIKSLIKDHGPTVGAFYETVLKKFLADFLPRRVKVGSGFLFETNTGKASRQMDIIIYSDLQIPPIYQHQDFVVVDYSTVDAVIEVKATVDSKGIKEASRNLSSAMEMLPLGKNWFLVGIRSELALKTITKHLKSSLSECSGIFILDDTTKSSEMEYFIAGKDIYQADAWEQFLGRIWDCLKIAKRERGFLKPSA